MHGREREYTKRIRHMRSAPTRGLTTTRTVAGDSIASTGDSFYKDGRRISVGDSALFEPPQNHPPFIGIIHSLSTSKDNNLVLGVSWLYRPSEVELGKGVLLDAEPNEIFYSFHKDEIPAASLLHPCKVAFLPKGVELSAGISSFVCRQVYDIANNCLWWLTDQDYIDERQEEVDKLLYKTRIEMHATVQPDGRSPKPSSVNTSTSQLKPASDNVQSSSTSYPSQVKRKKREHRDQGSEPSKRERSSKSDDGESVQFKAESVLKSEISKITEKGGLINAEGVEKLVQLMQPNREERNMDLFSRSMLAGVIAATDRFDCLNWFVQLRGLPVLDEWLQDIGRGRIGDNSTRKNGDKSVEEFLLVLLRALDKLPVNLHALQMCNIGRSVNHLRTNKNLEIQKKARSLVDTWKKRVEAEMNSIDSKSASTQPVSWSSKSRLPEVSHGGNRHPVGATETAVKSSVTQLSAYETSSLLKPVRGETTTTTTTKSASSSPRPLKGAGKDVQYARISVGSASLTTTAREERSSSSSQSHNCSQSLSGKEDARSSTAGSMSVNKISSGTPQHQKVVNGVPGPAVSGVQRETGWSRTSSLHRTSASGLTCEKAVVPVVEGNSRKLIVKIPNGRASPVHLEKHDQLVSNSKEKGDVYRTNITSDVNAEFCQSNDFKDLLTGSDEGGGSPDANHDEERSRTADDTRKSSDVSKAGSSSSGNELKSRKLNEASFSSMNALIESCVKCSESNASLSGGDDVGIKLLASVAAGEIPKSDVASPTHSPQRNAPVLENSCIPNYDGSESSPRDILARGQSQPDNSADADNDNGDRKISSLSSDEPPACNSHSVDLHPNAEPFIETSEKLDDSKGTASVAASPGSMSEKRDVEVSNSEEKAVTNDMSVDGPPDIKPMGNGPLLAKDKVNDLRGSVEDEKRAAEVLSSSSHLVENEGENILDERCDSGGYAEQKPPTARTKPGHVDETDHEVLQSSSSVKNLVPEADEPRIIKAEKMDTMSSLVQAKEKIDKETDHLKASGLGSAHTNQTSECMEENFDSTEIREHPSGGAGPHKESFASLSEGAEPHGRLRDLKETAVEAEETEECASTTADISAFSASGPPQMDAKVKFDLNEGFVADEGKFGEPLKLTAPVYPVHLMNQLPFPVSSVSISLSTSITVAAAGKRPFVPPEDLLRSKGELGWKGSAATSAFRPAEPRKNQEVPLVTSNTPLLDATASKHGRPLLDIDLNAPSEVVLDDVASQESALETSSAFNCATRTEPIGSAPARCSGGLDLDLNQVDEANDTEQYLTSSGHGLGFPLLPVKSSSSAGGFSSGEVHRDFDLNNGPAIEDGSAEPLFNWHGGGNLQSQPPISSIRMNNTEMGNFSSWFAPGNTGSPVVVPSILYNRGEKPFPGLASGGPQLIAPGAPQRILGPPTGGAHFAPDVYWGSVLSSSPTVPFPSTPFQYPVFPFGSSFPLPSPTLSAGSAAYMDSSSGGRMCPPAIGSQLQGSSAAVAGSSQYPRPYMVSTLLDGSSNSGVVENNRKWSRQGLDLNAGPGGPDVEGKEEVFSLAPRQLSFVSSQAIKEEQARMLQVVPGGLLKRKEPDGGWDMDGFRYKQSSRQ